MIEIWNLKAMVLEMDCMLEFNPTQAAAYRLLGYESRRLAAKDFNDDKKDAANSNSSEPEPQDKKPERGIVDRLGGMGIIVLFIAILPQFAVTGRNMFYGEMTGPVEDKITPRIRYSASWLWGLYVLFTFVEVFLLKFVLEANFLIVQLLFFGWEFLHRRIKLHTHINTLLIGGCYVLFAP